VSPRPAAFGIFQAISGPGLSLPGAGMRSRSRVSGRALKGFSSRPPNFSLLERRAATDSRTGRPRAHCVRAEGAPPLVLDQFRRAALCPRGRGRAGRQAVHRHCLRSMRGQERSFGKCLRPDHVAPETWCSLVTGRTAITHAASINRESTGPGVMWSARARAHAARSGRAFHRKRRVPHRPRRRGGLRRFQKGLVSIAESSRRCRGSENSSCQIGRLCRCLWMGLNRHQRLNLVAASFLPCSRGVGRSVPLGRPSRVHPRAPM